MDHSIDKVDKLINIPIAYQKPNLTIGTVGALLQKGYKPIRISEYFDCSRQAVSQFIMRHKDKLHVFLDPKGIMSAEYTAKEYEIMQSIDASAIKEAPLRDRIVSAGICRDKQMKIDGEDIQRIAIDMVFQVIGPDGQVVKDPDNTPIEAVYTCANNVPGVVPAVIPQANVLINKSNEDDLT